MSTISRRVKMPLATPLQPGAMSAAQFAQLVKLLNNNTLKTGAALTNASVTIQPFTDVCSQYAMAASVRTTNRVVTLGVTERLHRPRSPHRQQRPVGQHADHCQRRDQRWKHQSVPERHTPGPWACGASTMAQTGSSTASWSWHNDPDRRVDSASNFLDSCLRTAPGPGFPETGTTVTALADQGPKHINLVPEGAGTIQWVANQQNGQPALQFSATSRLVNSSVAQILALKGDRHHFGVVKPVTVGGAILAHPYATSTSAFYTATFGADTYICEGQHLNPAITIANVPMINELNL